MFFQSNDKENRAALVFKDDDKKERLKNFIRQNQDIFGKEKTSPEGSSALQVAFEMEGNIDVPDNFPRTFSNSLKDDTRKRSF